LAEALQADIWQVSILAMTWMYVGAESVQSAIAFSERIRWLIAPSITLFLVFPFLIR